MAYVDGIIAPVPIAGKQAHLYLETYFGQILKDHGASRFITFWQNGVSNQSDLQFPLSIKLETDEAACFTWVYWPDKATRDAGHKAFSADKRIAGVEFANTFNNTRAVIGQYEVAVEL